MKFTPYPGAGTTDHLSFYYGVDNNGEPLLVWQGTVADAAALTPSNMIPLPWTAIQAQGNGVINALYRIRENAAAQNFQQSLNTQVTVSAITVEMRNFVWYDAPNAPLAQQNQRPGATATGVVNCSASPWNFITLILRDFRAGDPGDDPLLPAVTLQAGDLVTVFWEYHPGTLLGDSAAPPAVLRVLDERPVPASFRAGMRSGTRSTTKMISMPKSLTRLPQQLTPSSAGSLFVVVLKYGFRASVWCATTHGLREIRCAATG